MSATTIHVRPIKIGDVAIGLDHLGDLVGLREGAKAIVRLHLIIYVMPVCRQRLEQRFAIGLNILGAIKLAVKQPTDMLPQAVDNYLVATDRPLDEEQHFCGGVVLLEFYGFHRDDIPCISHQAVLTRCNSSTVRRILALSLRSSLTACTHHASDHHYHPEVSHHFYRLVTGFGLFCCKVTKRISCNKEIS